jgi:preprotein translocase subunit SecE
MARNAGSQRGNMARRAMSPTIIRDVVSELRRVTWPSREETTRLTTMVIGVSAAIGIFLGVIDIGFAKFFDLILSIW